ncbi:MAG: acetyl-CoA carboxylase biotin carboxyl carrier protein [Phycisphaerae bacterium]|nr:acetyl-CoA carboxylase biotin carboxyl carrier protein [Phycisphaerae bacterium]
MIDVQQVRELVELMVQHGLGEIRIKQGDTAINLRKSPSGEVVYAAAPQPMMAHAPMAAQVPTPPAASGAGAGGQAVAAASPDEGLVPITSPMVGTLYMAADPDSPPFVHVGSEIGPNSPVCIIGAMKVFNEIKAEVSGTIERILVNNEQAVEFGQPLMMVRPRK